jgi:hypothetical protein
VNNFGHDITKINLKRAFFYYITVMLYECKIVIDVNVGIFYDITIILHDNIMWVNIFL